MAPNPRLPFHSSVPRPASRVASCSRLGLTTRRFMGFALLGAAAAIGALVPAAPAEAQRGRVMSSTSTRPPASQSTQSLQRLVSPLGSAANVRPGWYSENLGTQNSTRMRGQGHGQRGGGYRGPVYLPYPVYPPAPQVVVINEVGNYLLEAPQQGRLEGYRPSEPHDDYGSHRTRGSRSDEWHREQQFREQQFRERQDRERRYEQRQVQEMRAREQRRLENSRSAAPVHPVTPTAPRHVDPQKVVFRVQPADARIYLDGEPLGTAATVDPLALDPGVYVLEVEHEAHDSRRLVFGVTDAAVQVAVDLAESKASRRVRVR